MNKSKLTPLKNKLWKLTSEYIRRRDADENGIVACCTCGKEKHWKEMDAGHYIPQARGNATRWDLSNIHAQCRRCNGFLEGNSAEYSVYIDNRYGKGYAESLRLKSHQTVKFSESDYQLMIDNVKDLLRILDERN